MLPKEGFVQATHAVKVYGTVRCGGGEQQSAPVAPSARSTPTAVSISSFFTLIRLN
jgi:hypothetical protein